MDSQQYDSILNALREVYKLLVAIKKQVQNQSIEVSAPMNPKVKEAFIKGAKEMQEADYKKIEEEWNQ